MAIGQAMAALRAGDAVEAEWSLRKHLLEQPNDADVLAKLAEIAIDQGRIEEATIALRRAAAAEPSAERRLTLARHLHAYAGAAVALNELESFPKLLRATLDERVFEAALVGMVGDHDRQIALYEGLTAEFPNIATLWIGYGNALHTLGRTADAVAALRRAIAVEPTRGEAYWTLANFKSFRFTGQDLIAMAKALRRKIGATDRLHFDFALGKAFEDQGNSMRSFQHYAAGNRTRSTGLKPDQMRVTRFVDLAISTFGPELYARHKGAGCKARDPIFLIGLHRSGSTLIEQILSCHPMIEGTNELPVMQQIWDRLARTAAISGSNPLAQLAQWDSGVFDQIGAEYLERTRAFRLTDRPLFVDKLPANWLNVGLIRLALPNATIIDARRHPMACGFSNFKQHFAYGVNYSYSLESIGRFYRDYLRLMQHFDQVQPGAVGHVVNERLIENPDREIRRLLDLVKVPFDAACLDFHRSKRAVHTPSADQVRRPINRDGVDAWRAYERWLGPLKEALGPALEQWLPAQPDDSRRAAGVA